VKTIDKRKDVAITRIEKLKTGVDFYITSQRFARSLGKMLKDNFKGELKISYKLHTRDRQTSRDKYRATIMFRAE
jgi:nonsense-mediated mRNA decay protein 3